MFMFAKQPKDGGRKVTDLRQSQAVMRDLVEAVSFYVIDAEFMKETMAKKIA